MMDDGKARAELMRLVQPLVVEGSKVMEAFASLHGLHHTDVHALIRIMVAQDRGVPIRAGTLADELGLTPEPSPSWLTVSNGRGTSAECGTRLTAARCCSIILRLGAP